MKIRLSGPLERDSIVNGYGLRAVLWTQGCLTHCKGCQNPETWDLDGGFEVDVEEIKARLRAFKGQAGITFCGGEPFLQPKPLLEIANFCHNELGWIHLRTNQKEGWRPAPPAQCPRRSH